MPRRRGADGAVIVVFVWEGKLIGREKSMRELIENTLIVVQLLVLAGGLLILTVLVLREVLDDFQRFQRMMSYWDDDD